jgi:hypothetical protein
MFNYQNPIQSQPFVVATGLSRLLLLCRFDFRQKSWGLPAEEVCRDSNSVYSAHAAALAAAIAQTFSEFSDPSRGGANASKGASGRMGIRRFSRRPLGAIKPLNERKHES